MAQTPTISASASWPEVSQRADIAGVEIAWDSWGQGDGPPLVVCHGFSGSSFDFALHLEPLAKTRRVIALDQRGHGHSAKCGELSSYSLVTLASDLVSFLEQVVTEPVDLLGHSMGGRVVLDVALARPDLVASLVLMDTSAGGFHEEGSEIFEMVSAFLQTYDPERGLPDMAGMRGPEDDLIEERLPLAYRERRTEIASGFDPFAFAALGRELFGLAKGGHVAGLETISCPVTLLFGKRDHPLVDQAAALAEAIAQSETVVIPGAYHSPQLTHPAEWRQAVEDHLGRARG